MLIGLDWRPSLRFTAAKDAEAKRLIEISLEVSADSPEMFHARIFFNRE
jgi:hypothetical protein